MDNLSVNPLLFPIYGTIQVAGVFIWIDKDGVFLLSVCVLRFISVEIELRFLNRAFLEAIEGRIVSVECVALHGFVVARGVQTGHLLM